MSDCQHEIFNCVQTVPIFKHLNQEEMNNIYQIAHTKKYKKGEFVYTSGDLGTALYVVFSGKIKISRLNINGKEQVIRIVAHGDFLGELTLFSATELKENAEVVEDAVMCVISANDFQRMINNYPSITLKILDVMSRRLESAEKTIETINLNSVTQRVSTALLELFDGKNVVDLPMKKGDLASQIGTSQESLSRTLSSLQTRGIITLKGQKTIILNDCEKLIETTFEV
ncbi:Crp/Fnr family transcriptional regulator [Vagococcus elongatus]|nr:Crp/Fnr family transcriptional regulator [Vagococcus elongatus]